MLQVDLKVLEGRQQGKLIPLNVRQFLIGREQDCHLRPNSDLVSRHHCVFTIDDFTVRLRDLGSTNGTYVNGERLQGQVVLKPGDNVVVGKLSFEVVVRQVARVEVPVGAGKAGASAVAEQSPSLESMETALNVSDTMEFPATHPVGDDTAVLPSFPSAEPTQVPAGFTVPPSPYGVPPYGMPQGYGLPPGYPPGYPQGYPGGYMPGYGMPNYMPMPGYGMPQMMPPGYPMPQPTAAPAPAAAASQSTDMPEVSLPDPDSTGAKPIAPPPPPPPVAEGDAPAAPVAKKPSDAAADIIRSHRMHRPG